VIGLGKVPSSVWIILLVGECPGVESSTIHRERYGDPCAFVVFCFLFDANLEPNAF
jgi:hypothetical protein